MELAKRKKKPTDEKAVTNSWNSDQVAAEIVRQGGGLNRISIPSSKKKPKPKPTSK